MSGIFGSTVIKGNRLTDFANTTATVGTTIPWGAGRFVAPGNAIWAALPPKEQRKLVRQGKGGVKQETFTYTMSYAIGFTKAIYGYWWIKRNGKIVYTNDPNAPIEDQQYAAKWLEKATLYNGGEGQLPDPTIESYEGMGQVPAHKDISSIVLEDDDVTNEGGAVPSYEACVIATPPEAYLTSLPYPQKLADGAQFTMGPVGGEMRTILIESEMQASSSESSAAPTGGELAEPPPQVMEPDNLEMAAAPTGGELKIPPPGEWFSESELGGAHPTGGRLAIPPVGTMQEGETESGLVPEGGALGDPSPSWNPVDKGGNIAVSADWRTANKSSGNAYQSIRAIVPRPADDPDGFYFEVVLTQSTTSPFVIIGVGNSAASVTASFTANANGWGYYQETGDKLNSNAATAYGTAYVQGDIIGVFVKNGSLYFSRNGVWQGGGDPDAETGAAFTGLTGDVYPMAGLYRGSSPQHTVTICLDSSTITGTVPAGGRTWQ